MSEKYSVERPDWVPEDADCKFTTSVMGGIEGIKDLTVGNINPKLLNGQGMPRRKLVLNEDDYVAGVERGDRMTLSRAITLIESNSSRHFKLAQRVLQRLLPKTGNALRIGITGVPGAGKSTMIEAFGNMLCDAGHRVAVLTVDPTSSVTKGSILGDKTRMGTLSRRPEAFIRPSPAGGTLGGVARKSRETMLLCEAAGYDVIIIETVGVGQSETTVRSMVDFFLLIQLAGTGDELQGIKRGIMEMADAIVINKADGDNIDKANLAASHFRNALHLFPPTESGWRPKVLTYSGFYGLGIKEIWDMIDEYRHFALDSGYFEEKRQRQTKWWMYESINEALKNSFYQNLEVQALRPIIEGEILSDKLSSFIGAQRLLDSYFKAITDKK